VRGSIVLSGNPLRAQDVADLRQGLEGTAWLEDPPLCWGRREELSASSSDDADV